MKNNTRRPTWAGRALTLLAAILGWILFFYWWRRVALQSTETSATVAVVVLALIAVSILCFTILWIQHNLRLAQRGKRGFSTRYLRPSFERDSLDRPLVFADPALARDGTWFVVHVDAKEKHYAHQRLIALGS